MSQKLNPANRQTAASAAAVSPYERHRKKATISLLVMFAVFLVIAIVSVGVGQFEIAPVKVLHILYRKLFNLPQDWEKQVNSVLFMIRIPRVLAGIMVGAGLSVAGAVYQGIFGNPLVSPDVLGASNGAALGACAAIILSLGYFETSIIAFSVGLSAVILAMLISRHAVKMNPTLSLILSGMMIGWIFNAAVSFIKMIADPHDVLPTITYWLMGSLASIKMADVRFLVVPMVLGLVPLFLMRWKLNVLTLGENEAKTLGLNTTIYRVIVIACATVITAASVSVSGMIGWVGLVIPHMARRIVGNDFRVLLPASMLLGASYLLIVDDLARTLVSIEIPLGILTAFVGAPFFIYLILRKGGKS